MFFFFFLILINRYLENNQLVNFDMKNHEDALLGVEKKSVQHEFFNALRRIRVRYFSYQK